MQTGRMNSSLPLLGLLLVLGTAAGNRNHQDSFMGALKPSGNAATDKADAVAIEKLEKAAPEEEEQDAKEMKAVAEIEEKTGKAKKEDVHQEEADADAIEAVAEEEDKSMKKDAAVLEAAAKTEKEPTKKQADLAAMLTAVRGRCGPQTKIHLPLNKDAAGSTVWSDPFAANKQHPIGRYDVTEAKICGPGTFTFSPTSCGRMDYKPDIFEISPKERSSGCAVVPLEWCSVGGLGCMEVDC